MAPTVKTSKDVLQALHRRLDEINAERDAERRAFEADPKGNDVPKDSEERMEELAAIHMAMDRQHQVIAD